MISPDWLRDLVAAVVDEMTQAVRDRSGSWQLHEVLKSTTLQSADMSILVPVNGYHQPDGTKDPDGWARIDISIRCGWVAPPKTGAKPE